MSKKNDNPAADDLLDSLLEDIDNVPESPPEIETPEALTHSHQSKNSEPLGLPSEEYNMGSPSEYESGGINLGDTGLWKNLSHPNIDTPLELSKKGSENEILSQMAENSIKFNYPEIPDNHQSPNEAFLANLAKAHRDQSPEIPNPETEASPPPQAAPSKAPEKSGDETFALNSNVKPSTVKHQGSVGSSDGDPTIAVTAFAKKQKKFQVEEKVVRGLPKELPKISQVYTSVDASLAQAETLKLAQQRILALEKNVELLRRENEDLASAAEIIKTRGDELEGKLIGTEKEKNEIKDQAQSEMMILRGNLQYKELELGKAKIKIDELEGRLNSDFKKIRAKERELENRLELARAEKKALIRAKDDNILELQRKMDQIKTELGNYRTKVFELNRSSEAQNEQIRRTVRALRLALTSLETKNDNIVPIKKAE